MRKTSILVFISILILMTGTTFADVFVNIPDMSAYPDDTLKVPINVTDLTGLGVYSYQFKIKYDSTIVRAIGTDSSGTLTQAWGKTWINLESTGEIFIGNYGGTPLQEAGVLINILFEIIGEIGDSTHLTFQNFEFNAGSPPVITEDGSVKILHLPVSVFFRSNLLDSIKIIIDGIETKLPFDALWEYGSAHTIGTNSPQNKTSDVRFVFDSWSDGGDTTHSVIVISDTTFTINVKEQYLLIVNSDYGNVSSGSWYFKGSTATFSVDSLVQKADSMRCFFKMWNGTGNSSYTGIQRNVTIVMNDPVIETAQWQIQYTLKINSSYGNPVGAGWYDQGDTVTISIDSMVTFVEGTRYVFDSWEGKGAGSYSGKLCTTRVIISEPILELAIWRAEHYLWIKSHPVGITDFKNFGWYAKNQTATTDTAKQVLTLPDFVYQFQNWSLDGQAVAENPIQILMDTSHTTEAFYQIDSVRVAITTNIGDGTSIYVDGRKCSAPYLRFWEFQSEHTVGIDTLQFTQDQKTRYLFDSWSDQGEQNHIVKADTILQLTVLLATQHFLLVDTHPTGLVNFVETGWYNQGYKVSLPLVPQQIVAGQDTFNFKGWHLDNTPVPGNSMDVIMNKYHSAIALYKDLYFISGQITYSSGKPVANIPVDLSGYIQTRRVSSVDGKYHFNFLREESYVITPHFNGFQFEPFYRAYTSLQGSLPNQNFVAFDTLKPQIRLIYPNGGEQLKSAATDAIIWQAEDNMGIDSIVIALTVDDGINWQTIAKLNFFKESRYVWNTPAVSSSQCKICIRAFDFDRNHNFDVSDALFSITCSSKVVDELTQNLPSKFEVQQNFPNPFNNSTTIRFQISEPSPVNIKIFNMLGQEIVSLVDQKLNAGYHQINWDSKDRFGKLVSSGVYFYQVEASGKVIIKRLLYIR